MASQKNIFIFGPIKTAVFIFYFSLCKMVDSENSPGNYKVLNRSIWEITKNPAILEFVPDHLQTILMKMILLVLFLLNLLLGAMD